MTENNSNAFTKNTATIGPSINIKGEITGSEDLLIEGTVEGAVALQDNTVTVGKDAQVKANVCAKEICVEGTVNGDLTSSARVVVKATGKVFGNITCPCLSLEEGAHLKGAIDTEPSNARSSSVSVKLEDIETTKTSNSKEKFNGAAIDPKSSEDSAIAKQ